MLINEFENESHFNPLIFFKGWFYGRDARQVTLNDALEWISSMFFHKNLYDIDPEELDMALSIIEWFQERYSIQLPRRSLTCKPLPKLR